jgi:hypothetical protein
MPAGKLFANLQASRIFFSQATKKDGSKIFQNTPEDRATYYRSSTPEPGTDPGWIQVPPF